MDAYLLLGCNGHEDQNGFRYCGSSCNPIVDISKVDSGTKGRLINFLDRACDLFDAPCYDYNKCVNTINFLYRQFGTIDEEMLHRIQAFLRMHKMCGIYIMLILKEDYNE